MAEAESASDSTEVLPSQDRLWLHRGRPGVARPSPVVRRKGFLPSPAEGRWQELAPFRYQNGQSYWVGLQEAQPSPGC